MDPKAPAYEFRGSGIHFADSYLSDSIREHSCSTNEITMFGSVFFKAGNSAGPVIELSYADSFGPTLPVFSLQMDALADEIIVAYRYVTVSCYNNESGLNTSYRIFCLFYLRTSVCRYMYVLTVLWLILNLQSSW